MAALFLGANTNWQKRERKESTKKKKAGRIPFLTLSGFFLRCVSGVRSLLVPRYTSLPSAKEHLRRRMEFQVRSEVEGMQGGDTCFTAKGFVTETAKRCRCNTQLSALRSSWDASSRRARLEDKLSSPVKTDSVGLQDAVMFHCL